MTLGTALLGGWLLLTPPNIVYPNGKWSILSGEPLAKWAQASAHDTAGECERAKKRAADESFARQIAEPDMASRAVIARATLGYQMGRCVPAEIYYEARHEPAKRTPN